MANWALTIPLSDLWRNEGISFEERRNQVVDRIRKSRWVKLTAYPDTLHGHLNDLKASEDVAEFDDWWDEIYDLADSDRVWLDTTSPVVKL